jgi:hypothetical protein
MLHDRKSLAEAVEQLLAGKREPQTELERYALLRALAAGAKPSMQLDVREAVAASLFSALLAQACERAPAHVKASPALSAAWLRAATEQVKTLPEAQGCRLQPAPALPRPDSEKAAAELLAFEREVLLENAHAPNPADTLARAVAELEHRIRLIGNNPRREELEAELLALRNAGPDEARSKALAAKVETGNYGRLGKLLDCFSADDQAKLRLVDRALPLGFFSKLATLHFERSHNQKLSAFETARSLAPVSRRDLPHTQVVGTKLAWLPTVREGDQPPAELAEGLGSWQWQELQGRAHGAYVFVPSAGASESEAA